MGTAQALLQGMKLSTGAMLVRLDITQANRNEPVSYTQPLIEIAGRPGQLHIHSLPSENGRRDIMVSTSSPPWEAILGALLVVAGLLASVSFWRHTSSRGVPAAAFVTASTLALSAMLAVRWHQYGQRLVLILRELE
jgi:hypothetical protein